MLAPRPPRSKAGWPSPRRWRFRKKIGRANPATLDWGGPGGRDTQLIAQRSFEKLGFRKLWISLAHFFPSTVRDFKAKRTNGKRRCNKSATRVAGQGRGRQDVYIDVVKEKSDRCDPIQDLLTACCGLRLPPNWKGNGLHAVCHLICSHLQM